MGVSNKGGVEKTSYFLALCVDISKMVRDTNKVTTNDYRKSHMRFRLAPSSNFLGICANLTEGCRALTFALARLSC